MSVIFRVTRVATLLVCNLPFFSFFGFAIGTAATTLSQQSILFKSVFAPVAEPLLYRKWHVVDSETQGVPPATAFGCSRLPLLYLKHFHNSCAVHITGYYARFARIKSRKQQSPFAKENEPLQPPPLFGDFDDETGYNGRPPSAAVLQSAWIATFEGKLPCLVLSAAAAGGRQEPRRGWVAQRREGDYIGRQGS